MATMYQTATTKPKTPEELAAGAGATQQTANPTAAKPVSAQSTTEQQGVTQDIKPSTTNVQAAATAQNTVGNSTAGTTPPAGSTGSGLPAYAASYNFWQNSVVPPPAPEGAIYTPDAPTDYYSGVPGYDPTGAAVPTWQAPGGSSQAAYDALTSMLSGDASGMDTSALKNKLKEQRLQMEKDQLATSRQAAAGRGMLDSGYQSGQERRIGGAARKDILGGFRDVDIAAAEAGARNKIAASTALDAVLTGDTSRADVGFNNQLASATQQDIQNQFDATHGLDVADAQTKAANDYQTLRQKGAASILDKYKAETATTMEGRAQDIQVAQAKSNELLGRLGIAVNLEGIERGTSRDKMQFLVDMFDTLVRNEQHNAQMGLSWAQMGLSMDEIMASLIKGLGM